MCLLFVIQRVLIKTDTDRKVIGFQNKVEEGTLASPLPKSDGKVEKGGVINLGLS